MDLPWLFVLPVPCALASLTSAVFKISLVAPYCVATEGISIGFAMFGFSPVMASTELAACELTP